MNNDCRTEPTATDAHIEWLAKNATEPNADPDDTSNASLYSQDNWQPVFKRMRETAPVNRTTGTSIGDFWNVCSHALLQEVESRTDVFSSSWEHGGIALADPPPGEDFELPMFLAMDDPEHAERRRTVAPAFTPAEINRLSVDIRKRTGELLDSLPLGVQFNWVDEVSVELSTQMLALLLGFPWDDRHLLAFWSDWAGNMEVTQIPELFQLRREILVEMAGYFHGLWEAKRSAPKSPDLLSMMIHSDSMSEMGPLEFIGNLSLLVVGGNDTTRNSMSGLVMALDTFPDQRALLQADKSLIPNAVHEVIRWHTPIAHMRRTATADCELAGQKIAKGDKLALWYISANRDEAVFPDPDAFDLRRENARRHLSFGHGTHRCVGARLAELQLRTLIEEMSERRLQANVTGEVGRTHANFVHGFHKLEVELSRY